MTCVYCSIMYKSKTQIRTVHTTKTSRRHRCPWMHGRWTVNGTWLHLPNTSHQVYSKQARIFIILTKYIIQFYVSFIVYICLTFSWEMDLQIYILCAGRCQHTVRTVGTANKQRFVRNTSKGIFLQVCMLLCL